MDIQLTLETVWSWFQVQPHHIKISTLQYYDTALWSLPDPDGYEDLIYFIVELNHRVKEKYGDLYD